MGNKISNSKYIDFMHNKWPFVHNSKSLGQVFVETFSELKFSESQKTELVNAEYLKALLIISNNYIDFSS